MNSQLRKVNRSFLHDEGSGNQKYFEATKMYRITKIGCYL